jgi:hypothetical protein
MQHFTVDVSCRWLFTLLRRLFSYRWLFMVPKLKGYVPEVSLSWAVFETIDEELKADILSDASSVLDGSIECFGTFSFKPNEIPWHYDFLAGKEWKPGRFYQHYKLVSGNWDSDVKVPWELTMGHHLLPLAKAFAVSGDTIYAERVEKDMLSWIDQNPFARSINWTSPFVAAVQAVNWILALSYCWRYFVERKESLDRVQNTLYQLGVFIEWNLEKPVHGYASNHYYCNLVGLLYLGEWFKFHPIGKKWLKTSTAELFRETRLQFYPSGPHYELSTSYHRFVTEMLLSAICLLKRLKHSVPSDIEFRAIKAIEYCYCYSRPDGSTPVIGDADDGRLHILGRYTRWDRNDHRHLLAAGHVLFEKCEWVQPEPTQYQDVAWLLCDPKALTLASTSSRKPMSGHFSDAGIHILRNGGNYVYVKSSNRGAYESAGWHTHNDVLSFDLMLANCPLIVDPGVGNYAADILQRNYFRSTKMHNTVMINGLEQNTLGDSVEMIWENGGETKPMGSRLWHSDDGAICLRAGYSRLTPSGEIQHVREFRLARSSARLEIVDELYGHTVEKAEWHFILHPKVRAEVLRHDTVRLACSGNTFTLRSDIPLRVEPCFYSPSYKQVIETFQLRGEAVAAHGSCFTFTIAVIS